MNLQNEWYSLCKRLRMGPEPTKYLTHVKIAYSEPHRVYHTLEHVRDCLLLYHKTMHLTEYPIAIEVAAWFHDFVYDPLADDNQKKSAERCLEWLKMGPEDLALWDEVQGLILATGHREAPETNDQQIIADIDLSILGAESGIYWSYAEDVREECEAIPDERYIQRRIEMLKGLLARDTVYWNPIFVDAFGLFAEENILAELEQLQRLQRA